MCRSYNIQQIVACTCEYQKDVYSFNYIGGSRQISLRDVLNLLAALNELTIYKHYLYRWLSFSKRYGIAAVMTDADNSMSKPIHTTLSFLISPQTQNYIFRIGNTLFSHSHNNRLTTIYSIR